MKNLIICCDRTRSRILKHNSRLQKATQEGKETSVELRDQGLTRPKVLILLPFRDSALHMVNTISKLIEEDQVIDKCICEYGINTYKVFSRD